MVDLRIVDAPSKPTEDITGEEKLPTGGSGNYSVTLDSVADFTAVKKDLADNSSVNSKVNGVRQELDAHIEDLINPHQVTKGQIGLGNVDNTADADKPVSNSTQAAIITATQNKADKTYVDNKTHNSLVDRNNTNAHNTQSISNNNGETQQQINDYIGVNWYAKAGGYAFGDRVRLLTGEIVQSTVESNTNNPNVDMTGWSSKVGNARQIFDSSGKNQQELNNTLIKKITSPSEISDFKPNVGDVFYIAEKEAYFKTELGNADNILSFPAGTGKRAKLMHNGEIQYKNIGSTSANLMYAVNNDTTIKKVIGNEYIADSIVQINRDDLKLEFKKLTYPATISGGNNALSALIEVKPDLTATVIDTFTLTEILPEFTEIYPVSNVNLFNIGDWLYISNATSPIMLNYLVKVVGKDSTGIHLNYRSGWELQTGDVLTYKKVNVIKNVNLRFDEIDYIPTDTRETARAIALIHNAVGCNLYNSSAKNTFWPVFQTRFTQFCGIYNCKLNTPQSTATGGDGYLVQWGNALYMQTIDNETHEERHLHDITMGAYGVIKNNRSFRTKDGGFVTHGAYEHDCLYENNVGVLSFANSAGFGYRAKRMTVIKHNGGQLIAKRGVIDLTLKDVVIRGLSEINNDGFQAEGLQSFGGVTFNSETQLSKRETVLNGGYIYANSAYSFTVASTVGKIKFNNTVIDNFAGMIVNGLVELEFNLSTVKSAISSNINSISASSMIFNGGEIINSGLRWSGNTDQKLKINRTKISGSNSGGAIIDNRKNGGAMYMQLINLDSTLTSGFAYSVTQSAGSCQLDVIGGKYVGGSVRYQQATADLTDSYLFIRATTEKAVTRTVPTASAKVKLGDCLLIS